MPTNTLTLKSERQIQAEILGRLIAQLGINDVNPGSVVDVLTQAVSQQDFALYFQIAQTARLVDLDALTGDDLDNKAFEYGLTRFQPAKASGPISILRPEGFVKVSTQFYAGSTAPIAGQSTIDVNDASNVLIDSAGTLILGRGTNNLEEVNYSVAPTNMVTFWRFTLTAPLVNDHAIEETVILKQGVDEPITAGTVISVPATGVSSEIKFQTDVDQVLLAGELEVDDVGITAQAAFIGTQGNIPIGAIDGTSAFPNPPFVGARATNTSKFTTGKDLEEDDDLRDRIKNRIQAITRAVVEALKGAIVGLVDQDSAKRVVSASILLPINTAQDVKIYIDDGEGFEPSFDQTGFESLLDSATGGEDRLQIAKFPVVKAQLQTNSQAPFDFSGGSHDLTYEVGGAVQETITFSLGDFLVPSAATSDEVVDVINSKSTLLEARTADGGQFVTINAKAEINESLLIISGTAQSILNFPTERKDTIALYIDDKLKSKDGFTATLDSPEGPFDLTFSGPLPQYLNFVVDGKTANTQIATINLVDVSNGAAVTPAEVAKVINRDISGVTAFTINNGTKVRVQSNTKLSSASKVHVTGGTANIQIGFSTIEQTGIDGDYVFNRELGIVQLTIPLIANQSVTLGSMFTRAKVRAAQAELYTIPNLATLIIYVDGGGAQTVTFDASFVTGGTASAVAAFINGQLFGATAVVRTIGGINYVEIRTNTYLSGSIEIDVASTSNSVFGFLAGTVITGDQPVKAYTVSGNDGPYNFAQNDSLVVVVDKDIVNKTFNVLLNYPAAVTTNISTTVFRSSTLSPVFPTVDLLKNYYVAFTSGTNTTSGTLTTVTIIGGGTAKYTYSVAPPGFGTYGIGDLAAISGFNDSENNGYFVITAVGANWIEVTNAIAIATSAETATGLLSQRRQITAYNQLNGQITVGSAFTNAPVITDPFIVIPSTIDNLVAFFNNKKITSFSLKGVVEGVNNNTDLQLSSIQEGSDGAIQVTGGKANDKLAFPTSVINGVQAYANWTGLLKLVHRTVYGDETDFDSFPGYGAAGIIFHILAPTVKHITVELTIVTANGVTVSSLQNDINSAITGYINTLGLGDDVIIERIRAAVIAIPGIIDVVMISPLANIPIADNQKATISTNNITIG